MIFLLACPLNPATRKIEGTPTTKGEAAVTYYVTDGTDVAPPLTYTITITPEPPPVFTVEKVSADVELIRENASHGTAITVTVTLEEAADTDTKVTLDFDSPREGKAAERDQEFTAVWDAELGREDLHCKRHKLGDGEGYRDAHPKR